MSDLHDNANDPKALVDFSSVIAVAIHDMKNSLSLLMQSIEHMSSVIPQEVSQAHVSLNSVHYEANRMNTTLVQVLSLYRAEIDALPVNIDEVFIAELFDEIVESNQVYTDQQGIKVTIIADEDLSWYLDRELIYLLLHDVLINAVRYGCKHIEIKASVDDNQLTICVEDDGPGYPATMLEMSNKVLDQHCISEGRTGLGLFFARLMAQNHKNMGKQGNIHLANSDVTGGSVFTLTLP
ncbi:HAMP domain-containing sensor histidine kinase [Glaciecola sp. XM2]|uniref:sensor histidine kinase n=1 Tax=Glaciecola sp. XM2 TaxID=1914931 RepID=UPI0020331A20|nr:HAMP domain-containing sensor histidine kinase [Glaciecola sp. XM2]